MKHSIMGLAALALMAGSANAAGFIKFDGVDGEAMHDGHKGWIEIESFSWGMSQSSGRAIGGGSPPAGTKFANITLKRGMSTPMLMKRCASGEHIKSATLSVDGQMYRLQQVTIPTCSGGSSDSSRPMESLSLNFTKIEYEYKKQDAQKKDPAKTTGWDIKKNEK